jgi:prepilin-type N-terminal cleavage/methylation domain-containing protein
MSVTVLERRFNREGSMLRTSPMESSQGFTLLEVLVVCTLLGIVAIPLMMFTYKGIQSYAFLQAQSNTSTELGNLSERITKVLRGATAIINAGPNTLTVDGYFSPANAIPDQIEYYISGTDLDIAVTTPSGTAPNYTYLSPQNTTTYLTRVDLQMSGTPMFTYYDSSGNQLPSGFSLSQIYGIGIYVAANPSPGQVSVPISIKTFATLRNFKTNL